MKTINILTKEGSEFLFSQGISTPYLDSEILMEYVLNVPRSFIIMNHTTSISTDKEDQFWQLIKKRARKYPISHLVGKREFWSQDFIVSKDVLDPRPDSETIISTVLKYYTNKKQHLRIADFGTGSGCLLISLLTEYSYSTGVGFERSFKAYRIAYKNIKKYNLFSRAKVLRSSWTKCINSFDLIVSNPPYIRRDRLKTLQSEVQKEPKIALDGGVSGLDCYLNIFPIIKKCLKKNKFAILEIGEDQHNIDKLIYSYGLHFIEYIHDLSGKKRCIVIKQTNCEVDK